MVGQDLAALNTNTSTAMSDNNNQSQGKKTIQIKVYKQNTEKHELCDQAKPILTCYSLQMNKLL